MVYCISLVVHVVLKAREVAGSKSLGGPLEISCRGLLSIRIPYSVSSEAGFCLSVYDKTLDNSK